MRLLLSCDQCKRQYDATGRAVGSRFRCRCGNVMVVAEPRAHDAQVVRCSSCGAPRESAAVACRFCEADFTLHEQDLHTVCPECLTRVSDRAKFCHHCGVAITPESAAGHSSDLICPSCQSDRHLMSRKMAGESASVMECDGCAGMWLGIDTFERLVERAAKQAAEAESTRGRSGAEAADNPERWQYRPCPVCEKLMQRRHYGRQSGVIVDVCRDHGFWLDADELPRILAWIRQGGLATSERLRAEREEAGQRAQRNLRAEGESNRPGGFTLNEPALDDPWDVLFKVVGRLFER